MLVSLLFLSKLLFCVFPFSPPEAPPEGPAVAAQAASAPRRALFLVCVFFKFLKFKLCQVCLDNIYSKMLQSKKRKQPSSGDHTSSEAPQNSDGKHAVRYLDFRWTPSIQDLSQVKSFISVLERELGVVSQYLFQLEKGSGTEKYHFQCSLHMNEKVRCTTFGSRFQKKFLGSVHCAPISNNGLPAFSDYVSKPERVEGPWTNIDKPYEGEDLPKSDELHSWQKDALNQLCSPPDQKSSQVTWVYDPDGQKGKSTFLKYMSYHHRAVMLGYGKAGDLLHLVSKNSNRSMYLFNLSRSRPKDMSSDDLYAALESVKDGHFVSTKYETKTVTMRRPHVWVFANVLPNLQSLSKGRWRIFTISSDSRLVLYK